MQLIADRINELSDDIINYSDQYNVYTSVHMTCHKCQNHKFNLYERSWGDDDSHFSILIECTNCENRWKIVCAV